MSSGPTMPARAPSQQSSASKIITGAGVALSAPAPAHHAPEMVTQCTPSAWGCDVTVPRGGPVMRLEVSTTTWPLTISTRKRSRLRGAGPARYSPLIEYFEPWQGHSNHSEVLQNGTLQPRWTHLR